MSAATKVVVLNIDTSINDVGHNVLTPGRAVREDTVQDDLALCDTVNTPSGLAKKRKEEVV